MQQFFDVIQSRSGAALAGVTVTVYNSSGGAATLYSDNGITVKANPTTTNADGEYSFYAANGTYSVSYNATGYVAETRTGIVLFDPAQSTASSNISYNQGSTGAVTRTVLSKLQESVSVKDFGAKGDGVTNDTAAIQAAINASAGKNILMPSGNYLCTGTIILPASTTLYGDGIGSTTLIANNLTGDLVTLNGDYSAIKNITIAPTITKTSGASIVMNGFGSQAIDILIDNYFIGFITTGTVIYIARVNIRNCVSASGIGISIRNGNDQYLTEIVADNPNGIFPFAGLQITASGGVFASRCDFIRFGIGILVNPTSGQEVTWTFMTDVATDTCSINGWNFTPSGTGRVYGTSLENCWAASASGAGFVSGFDTGVVNGMNLTNFRALANGNEGIFLGSNTSNFSSSNTIASGNNKLLTGRAGIRIAASNITFMGGSSKATSGLTDIQSYGVLIDSTSSGVLLEGVDVTTSNTPILNNSSNPNIVITNCRGYAVALPNYANDAAAAAGGIPLYGTYRNGSVIQQRVV
jgi:hypothetical protein